MLDLFVFTIPSMISCNHVFTHANVDGRMAHSEPNIRNPLLIVMLPCECSRCDVEMSKSGLPDMAYVRVSA